jgi:hypothetical protein
VSQGKKQAVMSSDEQMPAIAEIENGKTSDVVSSVNGHNVDKVNDDEQVPESKEKSTAEDNETNSDPAATSITEEKHDENDKANNNKRDIDQVDQCEETKNGHKNDNESSTSGAADEEDDEEAVVSTTTNKKVKVLHPSNDEVNDEINGDTSSTSAKVPNEELAVV